MLREDDDFVWILDTRMRGCEDDIPPVSAATTWAAGRAPELWSCKLVNWVNYDTSQPQIINSLTEKLEKELLQEFSSYLHKLLIILSGKCPISKFKSDSFDWKISSLNILMTSILRLIVLIYCLFCLSLVLPFSLQTLSCSKLIKYRMGFCTVTSFRLNGFLNSISQALSGSLWSKFS